MACLSLNAGVGIVAPASDIESFLKAVGCGFSFVLGLEIVNGLAFWTASATPEKDDLRPLLLSLPFCHMKRRSSHVWDEVLGLLSASGLSGGDGAEVVEDWELERGL